MGEVPCTKMTFEQKCLHNTTLPTSIFRFSICFLWAPEWEVLWITHYTFSNFKFWYDVKLSYCLVYSFFSPADIPASAYNSVTSDHGNSITAKRELFYWYISIENANNIERSCFVRGCFVHNPASICRPFEVLRTVRFLSAEGTITSFLMRFMRFSKCYISFHYMPRALQ